MSDVTRVIGIDFGTSTSVVCVKRYQNGKPVGDAFSSSSVTFGNGQGDTRAYTVVRRNGDGTCTCGREAGDPAPEAEIFREFKMDLESPDDAKRARARALTEEFFKYLYRWYDHQRSDMGGAGDKEKTLVSYPAKWSEDTRRFMAEAAVKAGFPDVSVMDEPSAALYATLTRRMNDVSAKGLLRAGEPGYMLLVDMGAGTTDLAVCRYSVEAGADGIIRAEQIKNEIVSTWPESAGAPTFGGREVDRLLEGYLTDYMISCGLPEDMARQLVCGTAAVKPWKENVVSARLNEGTPVDSCGFLSGYMMLLPQKQPFPAIDRGKFEGLLAEKLGDFKALVSGCLDRASEAEPAIAQNGIDLVVLTGGHSVWYFTEELLNGTVPGISHPALKRVQAEKARVLRLSNPQETVALGLVYSLLPMRVEKSGELQWPYVSNDRLAGLADEYFRREGPSAQGANITDWLAFINKDTAPGDSLDGLCQYLRRKVNFLWRYDDSVRPVFPDVADEVYCALSTYYRSAYGLIERFTGSGIYVGKDFYPWSQFCEADLDGAGTAVLLQGFMDMCLRRKDGDPTGWRSWPAVSADAYGDCVQMVLDGADPFESSPLKEATRAAIMEKWHMCPDQPVYAIVPFTTMDEYDGFVLCRDGLALLVRPPISWDEYLEMDFDGYSILETIRQGVRAMVCREAPWSDGETWPEDIPDAYIGDLARVYIRSNWNNTWLPTALEQPGAREALDALRKQYGIGEDERIIAVYPGRTDSAVYTERGFYMPSRACT